MLTTIPYTVLTQEGKRNNTYFVTDTHDYVTTIAERDIIYIHKSNCPNCGGLLDGDELKPYTYCKCCGTKVWSEREVS